MASRDRAAQGRELGRWPAHQSIVIDVHGVVPVSKGSVNAFVLPGTKRAVVVDQKAKQLRPWEAEIRAYAHAAMDRLSLPCAAEQPFFVEMAFYLPRPGGDWPKNAHATQPLDRARSDPWTKPDLDKLERAVLDALTRIVWDDDSRVIKVLKQKRYAGPHHDVGVWIQATVKPASIREKRDWKQVALNMGGQHGNE